MSDEEIEAMAAQLEAAVRVEVARFRIVQHGGGGDESHVVANRGGYLLVAALFLRAATAPYSDPKSDAVDLAESEVIDENSDTLFRWFERHERSEGWTTSETSNSRESENDALSLLGCSLFCAVVAGIFLVGLSTVWRLIFG